MWTLEDLLPVEICNKMRLEWWAMTTDELMSLATGYFTRQFAFPEDGWWRHAFAAAREEVLDILFQYRRFETVFPAELRGPMRERWWAMSIAELRACATEYFRQSYRFPVGDLGRDAYSVARNEVLAILNRKEREACAAAA